MTEPRKFQGVGFESLPGICGAIDNEVTKNITSDTTTLPIWKI
jgi:hypothetical protein